MPDSHNARRNILARIRAAQKRPQTWAAAERAQAEEYLARHPAGPLPRMEGDVLEHFLEQAKRMGSTFEELPGFADVPVAVARFLASQGLPARIAVWPELADLSWPAAGITTHPEKPAANALVGVTGVFCAIAETGTLVLLSGPDTPLTTALLPETHIAVVHRGRIVPTMEAAFSLIRSECGTVPRAINMISGPSRTGDIEQTIVLGAHGPYRVHILVLGGL